jgi:predicted transcriptional regulator
MAQLVARDIMSKDVVTLSPEMTLADAADALLHYRIHGAPVVDGSDQLIGMVSFTDLSARRGGRVRDVMTADAVSVSADAPVEELAALMLDQMVRRVPVVSGGRVTGIVSASDIIQVFLNLHEPGPRQGEASPQARAAVKSRGGGTGRRDAPASAARPAPKRAGRAPATTGGTATRRAGR